MNKVCSGQTTTGMMSQDFSEFVKSFIVKDDINNFMSTIKGTPSYWKSFFMKF